MNEIVRAASIHKEFLETNPAAVANVKRAVRGISDAQN